MGSGGEVVGFGVVWGMGVGGGAEASPRALFTASSFTPPIFFSLFSLVKKRRKNKGLLHVECEKVGEGRGQDTEEGEEEKVDEAKSGLVAL